MMVDDEFRTYTPERLEGWRDRLAMELDRAAEHGIVAEALAVPLGVGALKKILDALVAHEERLARLEGALGREPLVAGLAGALAGPAPDGVKRAMREGVAGVLQLTGMEKHQS